MKARVTKASADDAKRRGIDPARLAQANINPVTGLATDYLNHFNEAIMLLEMIPDMPECAEDFLTWSPLSYVEHFWASNFKARDLAIEAYESADAKIRTEFDNTTATMTSTHAKGRPAEARRSRKRGWPRSAISCFDRVVIVIGLSPWP